jgi:ABC-type phosphate transport system substrate-binding protein
MGTISKEAVKIMRKTTKMRLFGVVAVAAAACITLGAVPAYADPVTSYPELAGVGSDTIQDVMNGVANAINLSQNSNLIGSYDAVDPVSQKSFAQDSTVRIQTRSGGALFARPNGSGDGAKALSYSNTGSLYNTQSVSGQVDFSRSSGGPSFAGDATHALTYVPFAKDNVAYAVSAASDFPRNIPLGNGTEAPTALTLWNIYHCTFTSYKNAANISITITPKLPQANSGTRGYWEGKVGIADADLATGQPSDCVNDTTATGNNAAGASIEEHNGTLITGAGDIVPFSISQYLAQGNHAKITTDTTVKINERRGNIALGGIGGFPALRYVGGVVSANASFPVNRLVYNVIPTNKIGSTATQSDIDLNNIFVGAGSLVCAQTSVIAEFGFTSIGSACGVSTGTSNFTP